MLSVNKAYKKTLHLHSCSYRSHIRRNAVFLLHGQNRGGGHIRPLSMPWTLMHGSSHARFQRNLSFSERQNLSHTNCKLLVPRNGEPKGYHTVMSVLQCARVRLHVVTLFFDCWAVEGLGCGRGEDGQTRPTVGVACLGTAFYGWLSSLVEQQLLWKYDILYF